MSERAADPICRSEATPHEGVLRGLLDALPLGVHLYRLEGDGRLVFEGANPAADRLTGAECGRFVGMAIEEAFPPLVETEIPERYRRAAALGETWRVEQVAYDHQGLRGCYAVLAFQLVPGRMAALFDDITDRKRAEAALREGRMRLESIIRAAPTGIGLVRRRVIVEANERVCSMLGYRAEELIGQDSRVIYPTQEEYEYVGAEKYRQIAESGTGAVETRWLRKDGTIIDVLLASTPLDPDNLDEGVTFTALDITDRKRTEEERVRLQAELDVARRMESLGRLAGGIAHDFNNMLGVILGRVELALAESTPGSRRASHLSEIRRAAEHSADLTRQLLAFARRQTAVPRLIDLSETIAEMLPVLRRLIGEHVCLEWTPERSAGRVLIDPIQVEQILTNLCANARDAIRGTGTVRIETHAVSVRETERPDVQPGDYVQLVVRDDGVGMDGEVVARLFEPFFTTKDVGHGTGLGLATVYGIVTQNGGFVSVSSEPGRGSSFEVHLPRQFADEAPVAAPTSMRETPHGSETVLVVEDNPMILTLTADMLEGLGYAVQTADSPRKAIAYAMGCRGTIDLLLTDVVMPEMDGRELAERLTRVHRGIGLLYMSGYAANVLAPRGVLESSAALLHKPFTLAELASKVREALDRRGV